MAAALMVIAFSQVFWEAGMGRALIQRQTDVEEAANVAFWINISLGVFIAGLLLAASKFIALSLLNDDRVTAVLQVMTLSVLLGSLSSVQAALLQKEMGFKKLFWVRLTTVALPGMASIPMALTGMGYWALVAGTLTGQAMQVAMLWRFSVWRPALCFNPFVAREMAGFGIWVGASGVLSWFMAWADSLIIGKYLGAHDLGIYRIGNQFATMVFAMVFGPITPVLYSQLSRMNKDRQRLTAAIEKVIRIIILTAIPSAIIIFSFSAEIGSALFGAKWEGVGQVLGVLALMHGFSWVVGMNGEVYRAYGRPSLETIIAATSLVLYLTAYIYTIQIGFEVFVWNRLALALGALLLHLYLLKRILGVKMVPTLKYLGITAVISFALVSIAKWLVTSYLTGVWFQMVVGLLVSALILGVVIIVAERNGVVKDILSLIKGR